MWLDTAEKDMPSLDNLSLGEPTLVNHLPMKELVQSTKNFVFTFSMMRLDVKWML